MNRVRIVHPTAGEAMVPESAVPHWRRCGWAPASERQDQEQPAGEEPGGEKDNDDSKPSGRSRRRSTKGDED